jgi:hypothetical protein
MVSMIEEVSNYIQQQISQIENRLSSKNIIGDSEGLFSRFIITKKIPFKINWSVDCNEAWINKYSSEIKQGNYIHLASLGFSIQEKGISNILEKPFYDGLDQLMKRDAFPPDRISFAFYPRMFLGIILGVKSLPDASKKINWFQDVFSKRQKIDDFSPSQKLLYQILESLIYEKKISIEHSIIESLTKIDEFSIVYWGIKQSIFSLTNPADLLSIKKSILNKFILESNFDDDLLPFVFFSVSNIVTETTDSVILSIEHISKILSNFESAMERWTWQKDKQWKIEDEYDVQNILYLILRSFFEDAEYEDPTQKFGSGSSRLDLKIPSQDVIVEAKFARRESDFKRLEKEIKVDSIDYIKSTAYKKIIVFIYDNSSSVQLHQRTINALKQIDSIHDVIIVSKPSHMKDNT